MKTKIYYASVILLVLAIWNGFVFTVSAAPKSKRIQNKIKEYEAKAIGVWTNTQPPHSPMGPGDKFYYHGLDL
ncbi:MAG: hypothetical protein ABIJ11_05620 [Elusimicrobiota bacterium]